MSEALPQSGGRSGDGVRATERPRRRSLRRRLATIAAASYLGWCAALFMAQGHLLFPRGLAGPAPAIAPAGAEQVWITAPDGVRVEAHYYPAPGRAAVDGPGPAVIFTHGNAELIHDNAAVARMYNGLGLGVLIPEYRGYGNSGGTPSQRAILADSVRFFDWLAARPEVDPGAIVLHGRSLGGGVAAQLATERRPAALILQSTFTSVASFSWRYGVPPLLVRHPYRTDRALEGLGGVPVMVIHGTEDTVVPVEHGRRLNALVPGSAYHETGDGHMDLPGDPAAYESAIRGFLGAQGLLGRPPHE